MKTNAVRILEQHGVSHRLVHYEVDENDLSAVTVARKVGMDACQVFKTLVCRLSSTKICFAVVPGDRELDLKVLAKTFRERSAQTVPLKDVQPLTGYIRGGVTVFGAKRTYPVAVDATMTRYDEVAVSAGARGTQIVLHPIDYVRVTEALLVPDLAR